MSGLEVDHQRELGRLHYWKISGPFAVEDSAGIDADLAVSVGQIRPVAHQSARHYGITQLIARWHSVARRQRDDLLAPVVEERDIVDEERTPFPLRQIPHRFRARCWH